MKESKRNRGMGVRFSLCVLYRRSMDHFFLPGNHSLMQEWHIAEVRKINDVCRRSVHTNLCQKPETLLHVYALALLHCCLLSRNEGPRTVRTVLFFLNALYFFTFYLLYRGMVNKFGLPLQSSKGS